MNNQTTGPQAKNRALWDLWAKLHSSSSYYDVERVKAGASSLKEVELHLLGDVAGKRLLHLQCHFGLDSVSLARMGAQVTGLDFSSLAVETARDLAKACDVDAQFVVGNVEQISDALESQFDIVYTSYGVLSWIERLDQWAKGIAHVLVPGGEFILVELHPFLGILSDDGQSFEYSYFESGPESTIETTSYAGIEHQPMEIVQWGHSLGEVVTALADAGMRIRALIEYEYSTCNCYPYFKEVDEGRYVAKQFQHPVPHMFSISAST